MILMAQSNALPVDGIMDLTDASSRVDDEPSLTELTATMALDAPSSASLPDTESKLPSEVVVIAPALGTEVSQKPQQPAKRGSLFVRASSSKKNVLYRNKQLKDLWARWNACWDEGVRSAVEAAAETGKKVMFVYRSPPPSPLLTSTVSMRNSLPVSPVMSPVVIWKSETRSAVTPLQRVESSSPSPPTTQRSLTITDGMRPHTSSIKEFVRNNPLFRALLPRKLFESSEAAPVVEVEQPLVRSRQSSEQDRSSKALPLLSSETKAVEIRSPDLKSVVKPIVVKKPAPSVRRSEWRTTLDSVIQSHRVEKTLQVRPVRTVLYTISQSATASNEIAFQSQTKRLLFYQPEDDSLCISAGREELSASLCGWKITEKRAKELAGGRRTRIVSRS